MSGVQSSRPERDLGEIRDGDSDAFVAHLDPWIDRMHDASQNIVGTTDAAATVCHDVVQSLWERRGDLTDDDLSRDALLLATRQRSLDHLASSGWHPPSTDSLAGLHHDSSATRYRVTLAHAAATVLGASNVSALDLHFRHGVDAAALSDALDVPVTAAPRRLAQLRSELDEVIAAYVLWSGARPGCPGLGEATDFDATVFATVSRHRSTCPECAREHRSLVNPAGLFLTAPTMTVAPALRQRVLSVAPEPDTMTSALVAAPIATTTIDDADAEQRAATPGIDELWAATVGAAPTPSFAPVAPSRPPVRRRTATIVSGAVMLFAVLAGGVAMAMRGSDSGDRIVVDRGSNSEQPQTDEEDPEVRSLAPLPSSTEGWTARTTSSTAASTTTSTSTTSTTEPATEPPETPPTTAGTQVATGVPPRPTSTRPSTPTSTVASSPVTTAPATTTPTTAPPTATTAAPTTTPPVTTTTAATTTTTTAPTTSTTTTSTTTTTTATTTTTTTTTTPP